MQPHPIKLQILDVHSSFFNKERNGNWTPKSRKFGSSLLHTQCLKQDETAMQTKQPGQFSGCQFNPTNRNATNSGPESKIRCSIPRLTYALHHRTRDSKRDPHLLRTLATSPATRPRQHHAPRSRLKKPRRSPPVTSSASIERPRYLYNLEVINLPRLKDNETATQNDPPTLLPKCSPLHRLNKTRQSNKDTGYAST